MRIVLAPLPSNAGRVEDNLAGLHAVMAAHRGSRSLVVVPEAFGQGFEVITDDPAHDLGVGWRLDGPEVARVVDWACEFHVAVCLCFIERNGDALHSTALVIDADGNPLATYRRMSPGWRHPDADPAVYAEGTSPVLFELDGLRCSVALCGDLWDIPERFREVRADVILWPVWVSYPPEVWHDGELAAYAEQAGGLAEHVLLVNAFTDGSEDSPDWGGAAHGGVAWFRGGAVEAGLPMDQRGTLVVDLS